MRFQLCAMSIGLAFTLACSSSDTGSVGSSSSNGDQGQAPSTGGTAGQQQPGTRSGGDAGAGTTGTTPSTNPGQDGSTGTTNDNTGSTGNSGNTNNAPAKQSLVWVWVDYANSLDAVAANKASFTHVSPALYQINYNYTSGVPQFTASSDSFNGLTSTQIAQKVHAMGMKVVPLLFGGGGNGGTDQGIHNILTDTPAGTQSAFITAMVNEAVAKGYDGYNLDWEVDNAQTPYATYGAALETFLGKLKAALNAHNMQLSYDLGTWYVKQTYCSGGTGVVDLKAIASNVDLVIMEAYANTLGTPQATCPASLPDPQACSPDFMSELNLMCVYVPKGNISIGYNANPTSALGNNPVAVDVVAATQAYGIRNIALWPDTNADGPNGTYQFADSKNNQQGTSWYTLMANFRSAP